ncbi:Talin-1, partial [Kappamyces sp. JEL0680]
KPLLSAVHDLSQLLLNLVEIVKLDIQDPNDVRQFQLKSETAAIKDSVASISKKLKESEKLDPVFSEASKVVLSSINGFDVHVQTLDAASLPPLARSAAIVQDGQKQLLELLNAAASKKNVEDYGKIATASSEILVQVNQELANIMQQTDNAESKSNLHDLAKGLGETAIMAIAALKMGSHKGHETMARGKINQTIKEMNSKLIEVEAAVNEVTGGIVAIKEVSHQVDEVRTDLESSLKIARAKELNPVAVTESFAAHKDGLLLSAQKLTEVFKTFVNANSLDQETLGTLVESSGEALQELKMKAIVSATALSSADFGTQQELLRSTMEISDAMKNLLEATANASGCQSGSAVAELNGHIEHQFDVVSKLVGVVKALDEQASRNFSAYQNVINAMRLSLLTLKSDEPAFGTALPAEVVAIANQLSASIGTLVAKAGLKIDDNIPLMNTVKDDLENLCRAGKAVVVNAPSDKAELTLQSVTQLCNDSIKLVESIQNGQETGQLTQLKQQLQGSVKNISLSVASVAIAASKLVPDGYVDPNDPDVIAERELLSAANAIEAAARKLAALKPAEKPRQANEDLNFDEQILEAAKGIIAASSALVRSATSVQREIVAKGKSDTHGSWCEGMVRTAKLVLGSTNELCEAANSYVKEEAPIERVIVCAKSVSASTIQLLTASGIKGDSTSTVQIRLQSAGKAVTMATEQLVKACQEAKDESIVESEDHRGITSHKAKILEMEAQMKVLRLEKELDQAREALAAIRKQKQLYAAPAVVPQAAQPKRYAPGKNDDVATTTPASVKDIRAAFNQKGNRASLMPLARPPGTKLNKALPNRPLS